MKKFKVFVDFKEEEKYLDDMAKQGYIFEKYSSFGFYTFRKAEPQDLTYKVDYRVFTTKGAFNDYVTLFEDSGWEHVFGTTYSGSQYFLPDSAKARTEDIFSDPESETGRYKRFVAQCSASLSLMIIYFVILFPHGWKIFDPQSWYLTNGLWDMSGSMFWKAFLFETPFVVLRIFPFVVFGIMAILYAYWGYKANRLIKEKEVKVV